MSEERKFLEFIGKLATQASKQSLVDALGDLGFKSADEVDSFESSSSSFSFAMQDTRGQSMVVSKVKKVTMSSDLAHRSWSRNDSDGQTPRVKEDDENMFSPFVGNATIMFIDLSGYSKIAAALTNEGGAHALSTAVNTYFESILGIVQKFFGDVISFAGDAICVCWPCTTLTASESALLACICADELQKKCGVSPVQGTDLVFRMHIGITMGEIESQILTCASGSSMQRVFHFVWGEPLSETALVVDAAAVGETAVTKDVRKACGESVAWSARDIGEETVFLMGEIDEDARETIANVSIVPPLRSEWLERNLVPPQISKKLRQGFKPSHLAEMRFLCVLFIRKQLANVSALEWFSEVQQILDENRCPIVQMIHDDKGTHLIAAVNLYRMERDPTSLAIKAARQLVQRETGCAVGIACGEVFCGVTGSDSACRWDITGPACVRACRLMQHAVSSNTDVILDESIHEAATDLSQIHQLSEPVQLKGSPLPVPVYALTKETREVTAGILSMSWTNPLFHAEERKLLTEKWLQSSIQRGVAIVSGPIGSGKKTAALIALEQSGFTRVTHFSTSGGRALSVLTTAAQWFRSNGDPALARLGSDLHRALDESKLTMSLNLFHQIVDKVIELGHNFCYIIAYATLLEPASLNLLRAIAGSRPSCGKGRFLFCLTAYPLYRTRPVEDILRSLERVFAENQKLALRLPAEKAQKLQTSAVHVKFTYSKDTATFINAFAAVSFFHLTERSSRILLEATGGCLLLIKPVLNKLRTISYSLLGDSGEAANHILPGTVDGTIHVTGAGEDYFMREINWPKVAPLATSRFTELYDVLSPRLQLILRVVASLSTTTGSANPFHVFRVMETLNSKVTVELILEDIRELVALEVLKDVDTDGGEVCFSVPAMVDVVMGLLTPDQDRMLKRQAFKLTVNFLETSAHDVLPTEHLPIFYSFVARLAKAAGDMRSYKKWIAMSWDFCLAALPNDVLRLRMEERLSTENRRNPEFCNRELFKNAKEEPLLEKYVVEKLSLKKSLMPFAMKFFATDFYPPMALGAISGEYQKMGWWSLNNWLEKTKDPGRNFLPPGYSSFLLVDLDKYFAAVSQFESIVPKDDADTPANSAETQSEIGTLVDLDLIFPMSLSEERTLLEKVTKVPSDELEAETACRILILYYYKFILPRRSRFLKYVSTLDSLEQVQCEKMRRDEGAITRAFRRFLRPGPIPDTVVHDALLDLATSGWAPKYYNVNLQLIRELIFKQQLATALDFKAFLLAMKMFGESITEAEKKI